MPPSRTTGGAPRLGEDVTYLCVRSDIGGYSSKAWTVHGWVLDDESMLQLQEEFPDEWFLGVTCSLGFPRDYSELAPWG